MATVWTIAQLERNTADGGVITAHWKLAYRHRLTLWRTQLAQVVCRGNLT
jgi:hypothetical protein